ncbi:MAG: DUF2442 domain-containing protein [Propionibacteriaceae bacterium]|jgi:hypothetical protein|nr:DUF2442 domain-containing protein [Propionibacteriaceae bacterium]
MHIINGIAYAEPLITVVGIQAQPDHRLWLRFSTGEEKTVDMTPLLSAGVFAQLRDTQTFTRVALDGGVPTWPDVNIDVSPEYLYQHSQPFNG